MSQTRSDILETLRIFLSDPKDQKWSKAHKVKFLNQTIKDVISSEVIPYVRVAELPIRDYEYEYDFPEDMLEPIAMMFQNIEGAANHSSGHISIRDLVSDNKFIFSPKYQAELYNYHVRKQTTLPSAMSKQEIWVDTFGEENFVYQCNESYDSSADLASVILDSDLLAGSTNLVFTYDIAGIKYIKVVVNNAGASGTSNVSTSGDANDRSNPLVYTFNIYDDDSSNNAIIALAPADLTITGADATVGSVIPTEAEFNNESAGKFTQQFIHLRYAAMLPALSNDDDPLHPELHALIREGDCIPYLAASKMLATVKGDERLLIMGRQYNKEAQSILDRVRQHRAGNGPPYDLEPS
jgi:hypothetical protein